MDIQQLLATHHPKNGRFFTIAIDGRGGSGKTSLVEYLKSRLPDVVFLNGDDYFEPFEGQVVPGGFNDERFVKEVITPLKQGNTFLYRPYDWDADPHITEKRITVTEGFCLERCYSFRFDLDWDVKIWVEVPKEVCLERGLAREKMPPERAKGAWNIWQQEEDVYIRDFKPQEKADIVVDGTKKFEEQLKGIVFLTTNPTHPILKVGDTIHRPTHFWSPAVHELLKYLESINFSYSSRYFGQDYQGREVLSHIDGESGVDGWKKITTDEGLRKYAKLLRAYHDAVADFHPSGGLGWSTGAKKLQAGDIICHGDFGPWNIVWQGDEPVGIIDWDMAHPALPDHDILYALEYAAPFRDDETAIKWHHFDKVPDRKHRIAIFLEAYGAPAIDNVTARVAAMQRAVKDQAAYLAKRGIQPQADWASEGHLERIEKRAQWTEGHEGLFE